MKNQKWRCEMNENMPQLARKQWKIYGYDPDKIECTCNHCDENEYCWCAWDLYNTGDDCLMNK